MSVDGAIVLCLIVTCIGMYIFVESVRKRIPKECPICNCKRFISTKFRVQCLKCRRIVWKNK